VSDVESQHPLSDGELSLTRASGADDIWTFDVSHRGHRVGTVSVRDLGHQVGDLTWHIDEDHRRRGYATRALRLLVGYAFAELDYERLEARVPRGNLAATRVATRAGLRREGLQRHHDHELLLLARLRRDPDPFEPTGFRALLNSALPRKRAIAQLAVRDSAGRLLLCNLTYKQDWDLPGGVVEDDESPRSAVERECLEELGLRLRAGRLLMVDWLPAWGGWDDACVFVFDGGVQDDALPHRITPEPREIRRVEFCDDRQVAERCADFTARRAHALMHSPAADLRYLESGR